MIILFVGLMLAAAALSGPAWWFAHRRKAWFLWDYATLVFPFAVWMALTAAGFGAQSLANLVEPLILVPVIATALNARVFLLDRWSQAPAGNSIAVFVICTLTAVGLRAAMPLIPE